MLIQWSIYKATEWSNCLFQEYKYFMFPAKECSVEVVFPWSLGDFCKLLPHSSKVECDKRHGLLL